MKKILYLFVAIMSCILVPMTSCTEFKLNEHMIEASMMVFGGEYNKKDSTTRRAFLTLMIKGINEDPYKIEYKIDGKDGEGLNALYVLDEETKNHVYNYQVFEGSKYMSEDMFSKEYEGNFPSGSFAELQFLDTGGNTHPNHGGVSFLTPKLEAGKHLIEFTVTNSYGDVLSGSKTFEIKDKPKED